MNCHSVTKTDALPSSSLPPPSHREIARQSPLAAGPVYFDHRPHVAGILCRACHGKFRRWTSSVKICRCAWATLGCHRCNMPSCGFSGQRARAETYVTAEHHYLQEDEAQ
jgi:hypothetical protein